MDFGLFYFADDSGRGTRGYRLLLEGAKFADTHDFAAVWMPERHFHEFGGQYPNPAVTAAAVAAVTDRVAIRAGSIVAPLHHPIRIAEEWSVVDNISGGRVGVSLAPGWHLVDFALRPQNYERRQEVLVETVHQLRRLWRREPVELADGKGNTVSVRSYPPPVQSDLPMWITSAGSVATFRQAGQLGTGLLTHLLGQSVDDLSGKVAQYRTCFAESHNGPGHVALMLHTFLGTDRNAVRETVRIPFTNYLRSSFGLVIRAAGDLLPGVDPDAMDPEDVEFLIEQSFDRYFDTGGLFGTPDDGMTMLKTLADAGVDEIACLIDFVPDVDVVLRSLQHLDVLRRAWLAYSA